ncbi:MAG: hypothetical protein RL026_2419 [Pseudomonadota bacterium]
MARAFQSVAILLALAPLAHAAAPAATTRCASAAANTLKASLRGGLQADLDWAGDAIDCELSPRPEGQGWRLTLAGPLAGAGGHRLRLVLGIDAAPPLGSANALPLNLTLIVEGQGRFYATRGNDKCTVDALHRTAGHLTLAGFCTGPATRADGASRVLLTALDLSVALLPPEETLP